MPKSIIIEPEKVFATETIEFSGIPVNAYSKSIQEELDKCGPEPIPPALPILQRSGATPILISSGYTHKVGAGIPLLSGPGAFDFWSGGSDCIQTDPCSLLRVSADRKSTP